MTPRLRRPAMRPGAALAAAVLGAAGWGVLGLASVPWAHDRYGRALLDGATPSLRLFWPAPLGIALATGLAALALTTAALYAWRRLHAPGAGPRLADDLAQRPGRLALIVGLASAALTLSLLAPGDPWFGDARTHLSRSCLWQRDLRAGVYPLWTDLWYGGLPIGQIYPPFAHAATALLQLLGVEAELAMKLLAWLCRISGAVGFALLCRRVHEDGRAGLLGGIIYALSPPFHASWIWEGRLPGSCVLGLLPWLLLGTDRLATGRGGVRTGAATALAAGALVTAHSGTARLGLVIAGALFVLRAWPARAAWRGPTPRRRPALGAALLAGTAGAALVFTAVFPLLRHAPLLNSPPPLHGLGFAPGVPTPRPIASLLTWFPFEERYVGLSVALLAVCGVVAAARRRPAPGEAGRGGDAVLGPWRLAALALLPWLLVTPQQRNLDLIMIGAQLAAAGAACIPERGRGHAGRSGAVALALALALVVADLGPLTLITTYVTRRLGKSQAMEEIAAQLGSGRLIDLPVDSSGRPRPNSWLYAPSRPVPTVGGPFIQGAPHAFVHSAALLNTIAHSLAATDSLPPEVRRLAALHNVRCVAVTRIAGAAATCSALWIPEASPVAVLTPDAPPAPPTPDATVAMHKGLPPEVGQALMSATFAWLAAADPRPVPGATAEILPNRLHITTPDVGRARLRLARNVWPSTRVEIDGRPAAWMEGPLGGITVDVAPGPHRIDVRAVEAPDVRAVRFAQAGLAVVLATVALAPRRRSQR